jgi:ABC-2 type transport system ATP-binding protein
MLKVSNLRKDFATIRAVDGVSFQVERGNIFGLIGRNGAGKSTTIRCVLDILKPDQGEISYDGKTFSDEVRNIVGYLPEERGLYKKSKVLDTILYFAQLRGMDSTKATAEGLQWLKRFELLPWKDKKVEELSKGNQQKVQFICSIIHDPQLVILDEPFSGLDPVNQILFKDILLELKQRNKAVIFSTHQMDQAEKLSDEICLINHGRIVLSGSVRDVKRRYGSNSVHLEYEGNGTFLRSLAGVKNAMMYENTAELQLETDYSAQVLLEQLVGRLELRKFELREPSLQSIFIQEVGEKDAMAVTA